MARVAASVDALGPGAHDGEKGIITAGDERVKLRWNDGEGVWIGEPQLTITFGDLEPMPPRDNEGQWNYVSETLAPAYAYSWEPRAIRNAMGLFAAGLTLQEKLDADFWIWDPDGDYDIAVVYYNKDDGDTIAPGVTPDESSPARDTGTRHPGTPTVRCFTSSGWVDCPIDAPSEENLAPHLYSYCTFNSDGGGARIERFASYIRWVGVPS